MRRKILHSILAMAVMFSILPVSQLHAEEVINVNNQAESTNYVVNPGFENGITNWDSTGGAAAADAWGGVRNGGLGFQYQAGEPFLVKQTITGLPSGLYTLNLWVHGENNKTVEVFAENSNGGKKLVSATTKDWTVWQNPQITDIQVTTGQILTIGAATLGANSWGWIDDVSLTMQPVLTADKTELQIIVDAAKLKVNAEYTRYSWNKFAEKLADAEVILDKIDAAPEEIASAKNQLTIAMSGLLEKQIITYDSIHVNPISELQGRTDFINGVDVSSLWIVAQKGAEFYDENGDQPYPDDQIKNCLAILQDNGVNWIRLRIWNDPNGALTNPKLSDKGPGGLNDVEVTKEIAKKAKELGLKVLLDFHYSDTWAHPGQQIKPAVWEGLGFSELKQELYNYTDSVLEELNTAGALPDMVQIGNENNDGMVHADGKVDPNGDAIDPSQYIELVKAGIDAVRDNELSGERIKIMIHLAEGGKSSLFRRRFDLLQENNVDYDVIGASYYPYWHGAFSNVQANLDDMAIRYGKEVVIAEVAYGYTNEYEDIYPTGTQMENIFAAGHEKDGKYKASIQGQATALRDVIEIAAKVPNNKGIGTFYWEPAWLTTPEVGAGWGAGDTTASWANQALFNYRGQALPSIATYNLITQSTYEEPTIVSVAADAINISISQGSTLGLPSTVDALYSDDSMRGLSVQWAAFNPELINQVGTFKVDGQIVGRSEIIQANITVTPTNYVKNPSFEDGSIGWIFTGSGASVLNESGNAKSGSRAVNYGNGIFKVEQTITGLQNGSYTLKLCIQGEYDKTINMFAESFGGETRTETAIQKGWIVWQTPQIADINVTNGQCTIGISSAGGSEWGWLDDVELILVTPAQTEVVDKTGLQQAISTALQKNESEYTAATWTVFAGKLAAAQSVLAKMDATSAEVLAATTELQEVMSKLVKNQSSTGNTGSRNDRSTPKDEKPSIFEKIKLPELETKGFAGITDIAKHWAASAIKAMVDKGVMVGKTATEFRPQDPMNRAEIAAILARLLPEAKGASKSFKDIKGNEWYAESINRMASIGILGGYRDSTFKPKDSIKRIEVIVLLARLAAYNNKYQPVDHIDEILAGYKDADSIPNWAKAELAWAVKYGIVSGDTEGSLNPNQNITRGEIASILDRMLD